MNEFDVTERTKKHAFRASALDVIYNQSQTDALWGEQIKGFIAIACHSIAATIFLWQEFSYSRCICNEYKHFFGKSPYVDSCVWEKKYHGIASPTED